MKKGSLKSLVIVMMLAMVFTMMPQTASAASKNPGKTKITSYKIGKYTAKTNSAKVTIKWKKASKATGYIIYAKYTGGTWKKVKKVGRFTSTLIVKKAGAGRLSFRVQAIRKVKGKTYKGKFSAAKTKFIKSKLTLEQYVNRFEPELKNKKMYGAVLSFKGNNAYLTFDFTNDPEFANIDPADIRQEEKDEAYAELGSFQGDANKLRKTIEDNSGVKGVGIILVFKLKNVEIVRRSF